MLNFSLSKLENVCLSELVPESFPKLTPKIPPAHPYLGSHPLLDFLSKKKHVKKQTPTDKSHFKDCR